MYRCWVWSMTSLASAAVVCGLAAKAAGESLLLPPSPDPIVGWQNAAPGRSSPVAKADFQPQPPAATQIYSHGDPTADEQMMLEFINRARINPAAEGKRLAA